MIFLYAKAKQKLSTDQSQIGKKIVNASTSLFGFTGAYIKRYVLHEIAPTSITALGMF